MAPAKTRPGGYGVKVRPLAQDWRMRFHGPMKNLYPISPEVTVHTVPYGPDLFRAVSLAVNCQATITWSLRDKPLSRDPSAKSAPHQDKISRTRRREKTRKKTPAHNTTPPPPRIN